ncbi:MAG: hypothetical protein AB7G28_23810 [Pirellulales bacterium]
MSFATPALADHVLLAAAEMGAAGRVSGTSVTPAQFVGWRFSIDEPLRVERVGGHIYSDPFQAGEIFAALLRLDSLDAVPHGAPFTEDEVVASTTFRANFPSDEYLTPLSATLSAGSYVLVFGTGYFGAEGFAALPNFTDQPDIPPTDLSSFIFWSRPSAGAEFEWRRNLASHMRVLVEGQTFPLSGDYDLNGVVNDEDYELWRTEYEATGNQNADGSRNEIVDAADYTVWRDHLGDSGSPGAAALVPEPAAGIIAVSAVAWLTFAVPRTLQQFNQHERVRPASLWTRVRAAPGGRSSTTA